MNYIKTLFCTQCKDFSFKLTKFEDKRLCKSCYAPNWD